MTEKQLHRASKKELIELLYHMSRELDKVKEENEKLNAYIRELAAEGAKHIADKKDDQNEQCPENDQIMHNVKEDTVYT